MNLKKLYQTVNYILAKYKYRLNYTKLIKLLYIADRICLEKYNFAISGDKYCSMPQGLVLSNLYEFINRQNNIEFNSLFIKNGYDLISIPEKKYPFDELCEAELEILDEVDKKYHNFTWQELVDDVVHKFPEWDKRAQIQNTSIDLQKYVLLEKLGKTKKEIEEILKDEESSQQIENSFKEKGLL